MFSLASPVQALIPAIGGILLGLTVIWLRKRKFRTPVDPIEANALYGGGLSLPETFIPLSFSHLPAHETTHDLV